MSHQPLPLLTPSVDAQFAGVLIANMLEAWLTAAPALEATEEAMNDHQDHRTALQQTGVHLYPSVDSGPGTASSGEYRTLVCAAGQSVGTGLARDGHPHVGSGSGSVGCTEEGTRGLQDTGGRWLYGASVRGVFFGCLASVALDPFFFFQVEDGIRDDLVTGVQRVLFRSFLAKAIRANAAHGQQDMGVWVVAR